MVNYYLTIHTKYTQIVTEYYWVYFGLFWAQKKHNLLMIKKIILKFSQHDELDAPEKGKKNALFLIRN